MPPTDIMGLRSIPHSLRGAIDCKGRREYVNLLRLRFRRCVPSASFLCFAQFEGIIFELIGLGGKAGRFEPSKILGHFNAEFLECRYCISEQRFSRLTRFCFVKEFFGVFCCFACRPRLTARRGIG